MENYRNVAAIVTSLTVLQAALGALSMIGPLTLASQGEGALAIATVATAYSMGFLIAVRFAPREIIRIGHIRAICAFAAIAAVAASIMGWTQSVVVWAVAHAVIGASAATLFAAGESWIASSAPVHKRGSVLSFYFVASRGGFMCGPFIAAMLPAADLRAILLVVTLFAAALIPVAATRRSEPVISDRTPLSLRAVWAIAPAALIAAVVAGMTGGAVRQLYPVFVGSLPGGDEAGFAAVFNGAIYIGAILLQWPAGLLSDVVDRRLAIAVLAVTSAIAALAMALFSQMMPPSLLLVFTFVWGGASMSIYSLSIAHASDRAEPADIPALMSAILLIWALGAMLGPLLGGVVMQLIGGSGLFWFCAGVCVALVVGMVIRREVEAPVAEDEKVDFQPAPPTSTENLELNPNVTENN